VFRLYLFLYFEISWPSRADELNYFTHLFPFKYKLGENNNYMGSNKCICNKKYNFNYYLLTFENDNFGIVSNETTRK
jgi:hypothetical protein